MSSKKAELKMHQSRFKRPYLPSKKATLSQRELILKKVPVYQKTGRQHGCQSLLPFLEFSSNLHAIPQMCTIWKFPPTK